MDETRDVTRWIGALKSGDDEAAAQIWDRFFHRVRSLAEKKLGSHPRRDVDAEDLALSAMNALCLGARDGKFRKLSDREDLWQILAMITSRKAANSWRRQGRRKELGESVLSHRSNQDDGPAGIERIADESPEAFLDSLSGTCGELLSMLDDRLKAVALMRLEGHSNEEIAARQDRSVKSVERYLKLIRQQWSSRLTPE